MEVVKEDEVMGGTECVEATEDGNGKDTVSQEIPCTFSDGGWRDGYHGSSPATAGQPLPSSSCQPFSGPCQDRDALQNQTGLYGHTDSHRSHHHHSQHQSTGIPAPDGPDVTKDLIMVCGSPESPHVKQEPVINDQDPQSPSHISSVEEGVTSAPWHMTHPFVTFPWDGSYGYDSHGHEFENNYTALSSPTAIGLTPSTAVDSDITDAGNSNGFHTNLSTSSTICHTSPPGLYEDGDNETPEFGRLLGGIWDPTLPCFDQDILCPFKCVKWPSTPDEISDPWPFDSRSTEPSQPSHHYTAPAVKLSLPLPATSLSTSATELGLGLHLPSSPISLIGTRLTPLPSSVSSMPEKPYADLGSASVFGPRYRQKSDAPLDCLGLDLPFHQHQHSHLQQQHQQQQQHRHQQPRNPGHAYFQETQSHMEDFSGLLSDRLSPERFRSGTGEHRQLDMANNNAGSDGRYGSCHGTSPMELAPPLHRGGEKRRWSGSADDYVGAPQLRETAGSLEAEAPDFETGEQSREPADSAQDGKSKESKSKTSGAGSTGGPQEVGDPYAQLIYKCLLHHPRHAMTLQEIYQWFRENTNKTDGPGRGWMNSIRHNLSMNQAFGKRERQASMPPSPPTPSLESGAETAVSKAPTDTKRSKPSARLPKKVSEWVLEDWAVATGVQSTTRYRKGAAAGSSNNGGGGRRPAVAASRVSKRRSAPGSTSKTSTSAPPIAPRPFRAGHSPFDQITCVSATGVLATQHLSRRAVSGRQGGLATAALSSRRGLRIGMPSRPNRLDSSDGPSGTAARSQNADPYGHRSREEAPSYHATPPSGHSQRPQVADGLLPSVPSGLGGFGGARCAPPALPVPGQHFLHRSDALHGPPGPHGHHQRQFPTFGGAGGSDIFQTGLSYDHNGPAASEHFSIRDVVGMYGGAYEPGMGGCYGAGAGAGSSTGISGGYTAGGPAMPPLFADSDGIKEELELLGVVHRETPEGGDLGNGHAPQQNEGR